MTENDIEKLGFDLVKSYPHDQWHTRRFKKGCLQIEFTYKNRDDSIETIDVTIDEIIGKELPFHHIQILDIILNKK